MKKFIAIFFTGFLSGALLFTALPTLANISDYILHQSETKVTIDGTEYSNQDLPVLYLDPGYNYLPAATFRDICTNLGISFQYNGETKTIELITASNEKPNYTIYNGYEAVEKDGLIYVILNSVQGLGLYLEYDDTTITLLNKNGDKITFNKDDMNYCIKYGTYYIKTSIVEELRGE